ncbi:hypothetical protein IJI31_03880 [bacterium]|nr:hypothetical protein [bacterium]
MALKFIDIYNDAAAQAWSMFDSEIEDKSDFDKALVSSINKALSDLWASYPFPFRLKNYSFYTRPHVVSYPLPYGQIMADSSGFDISLNGERLILSESEYEDKEDLPQKFYFKNNYICLNPIPDKRYKVDMSFLTLAYSVKSDGTPVFELKNEEDLIDIPDYLNTLFKNALITKTMLYSISSKSDEIYSGYKEQFEKAFRLLVKYSKSVNTDKKVIL